MSIEKQIVDKTFMNTGTILILASGAALGAYIPPLIICNQLKSKGLNTEFYLIENLIHEEKIAKILKHKFAYHRDFKIALMGQKLTEKSDYGIDANKVQLLYTQWDKMNITRFLVFSGFWSVVIDHYLQMKNIENYQIDLLYLDSSNSTSWKNQDLSNPNYRNIRFFNLSNNRVNYYINISDKTKKAFKNRTKKFVIHGGGWGMGTYKEKIQKLTELKIRLDIINYEIRDIANKVDFNRNYLIDPDWKSWEKYNLKHVFPPFGEVKKDNLVEFVYNNEYPAVYDLISDSFGIISKPGGATLLDSFSSATPVIFLEPFGEYEKDNATLWRNLGFGIDYNDWLSMSCSGEVLEQMHDNLLKEQSKTQNIIDLYA